jgi:tetratricopeptide (TPR) repeat protein
VAAPDLSFRRKLLYAAILTAIATGLLLGTLEAGLRLAGYGYSPHFVRRAKLPDGKTGWRENRWCTAPCFSPALVRRPQAFRLPEKKAPGAYRIFVLGDSAAMGDPEPSFSIGRVLGAMLRAAYPHEHFDVVNAAVTAINSHLERGIAADCARLEPDLFIVYAGNNEVIGPFGPSGVFTPFLGAEAAVRSAVWLKGTRTGQLFSAVGRHFADGGDQRGGWGGMQMFLKQQIAADDPRLDAVRGHFRANLRAIAAAAHRAGAATLLCTVLTNQRDFAPFMSQHRRGLSADELARWRALFDAGNAAERDGDSAAAARNYRAALAIDDRYAELVFRLGRLELQAGRDDRAKPLLQRALDLDTLRFRTDSTLNAVIRDLGRSPPPGLEVVDLASDLAALCAHGIPGDELLYEHVHLTFRGAYEAAAGLFSRVSNDLVRRGLVTGPAPVPFDYAEARVRLGYTVYEQAMIAAQLLARFRAPPFSGQSDDAYRIATWERRANAAGALLARPDALPALREVYRQAIAASPGDWILARNAGEMMVARKDAADALPLLQRAAAWIDDDIDTLVALGWAQRALGHSAKADAIFARARKLEPHYPGLPDAPGKSGR